MSAKAKDENDLHREGKLPADPETNVVAMPGVKQQDRVRTEDPSDVVAEKQLLGTLLWCAANQPDLVTLASIRDLVDTADQFYDGRHRAIFGAMLALSGEGKAIDLVSIHGWLLRERREREAGGMAYLETIVAEAETASELKARTWADFIRDAYGRRLLIDSARALIADARKGETRAEAVAQSAIASITDNAVKIAGEAGLVPMKTAAANVLRSAAAAKGEHIPTGVTALDAIIGGLFPRDVSLLAGGTSVGKSVLAMQLSMNIVRRAARRSDGTEEPPRDVVLYATMETASDDFARRVICAMSGVDLQKLRMCLINPLETQRVTSAYQELKTANILFSDGPGQSILDIDGKAERTRQRLVRENKRLALIVIDTLGLVKASAAARKSGNEQTQIAESSKGLRYLARRHECAVLALHHINREGAKREGKARLPRKTDLRGSGATENDADNVILLHIDSDKNDLPIPGAPAACVVAKARNGKKGIALLNPDFAHGRFSDWTGDDGYYDR